MQRGEAKPQLAGIDYLTKEEKGTILAYDFLRDDVTILGGKYAQLQKNDDRVQACHQAWMDRLAAHPNATKLAHKYVISLPPLLQTHGGDGQGL